MRLFTGSQGRAGGVTNRICETTGAAVSTYGRSGAAAVKRIDPNAHPPVLLPLRQMHMPDAHAGPADLLAGTNLLSRRHSRRHVPVREMTDLDATVHATATLHIRRRGRHARIERIDAVRQPRRRPGLGTGVVDVDIDPEVVARQAVVISPTRVDERPPDRMLHRPRRNRPTPRQRVVEVRETRRQRTRHTTVDRPVRRRLRRNPNHRTSPISGNKQERCTERHNHGHERRESAPPAPAFT